MNQRFKVLKIALVAGHQTPEVLQPRVRSLNNPASFVAPEFPPVLVRRRRVVPPFRDDRLDLPLYEQSARPITIVATICNQTLGLVWATAGTPAALHLDAVECPFEEFHFRRGRLLHAYSERSALAICQYHTRRPLAACGLAHPVAPFFATTNMPSTQHSFQRILRASFSWSRKARHKCKRTPLAAHAERRRWTALLEPYRAGSSLHGAPVHSTHRIPSKHWRSLRRGRPPRLSGLRSESCASINFHCVSVTARQAIGHLRDLVSYRIITACQPV